MDSRKGKAKCSIFVHLSLFNYIYIMSVKNQWYLISEMLRVLLFFFVLAGWNALFFKISFRFTANLAQSCAWPHTCTRMVHLPQLIHLHWHVLVTQSPRSKSGFSLGGVHPVGFDKCVITLIHHCSITQNSFTALTTLCTWSLYPSIPS